MERAGPLILETSGWLKVTGVSDWSSQLQKREQRISIKGKSFKNCTKTEERKEKESFPCSLYRLPMKDDVFERLLELSYPDWRD
ncbi:hypothetical protein QQP08_027731 [Theobroma cacao]|nr:hypothetical protein QQP08_027731 [Theobroma cacao]